MNKTDAALQTIPGTLPALGEPLEGCVYSARCPCRSRCASSREPDSLPWPGDAGTKGPGGGRGHAARPRRLLAAPRQAAWATATATCAATSAPRGPRCRIPPRCWPPAWRRGADESDVLAIDNVVRTFKDGRKQLTAVADVSLGLQKGETFGLVGESGSGKTTLAKCVTGLLAPDSGTITFEGGVLQGHGREAARRTPCAPSRWSSRTRTRRSTRPGARARSSRAPCASWAAPRRLRARQGRQALRRRARRAAVPVPAADRALRRPEAARRDRPRVRRRPAPGHLRRAGVGARRLRAGEHPQPARRAADQGAGLLRVHQPRSRRGALHLRSHRSHVPRGAHRGRRRGGGLQPAAPPLHGGAPQLDPASSTSRSTQQRVAAARLHAEPDRAAVRLPLPHALSPRSSATSASSRSRRSGAGNGHTYKCHIPPDELRRAAAEGRAPEPETAPTA